MKAPPHSMSMLPGTASLFEACCASREANSHDVAVIGDPEPEPPKVEELVNEARGDALMERLRKAHFVSTPSTLWVVRYKMLCTRRRS